MKDIFREFDFGVKDDNGKPLFVDDIVRIESGDFKKQVKLEFDKGIFGFVIDEGRPMIPIAWHCGSSLVEKVI